MRRHYKLGAEAGKNSTLAPIPVKTDLRAVNERPLNKPMEA